MKWLYYQYICWHTQLQIIKKYAKFSQNIYKFGNFAIITKRCFVRFPPKITIEVASRWNFFFLRLIICKFNYYKWKFSLENFILERTFTNLIWIKFEEKLKFDLLAVFPDFGDGVDEKYNSNIREILYEKNIHLLKSIASER